MFMSNEEVGIYIRLLCAQHQHNGRIKDDDFESMVTDSKKIRSKFLHDDTGYFNERLNIEILKRSKNSNASRTNGTKGGRPKEPKQNLNKTHRFKKDNLSEDVNENEIENINNKMELQFFHTSDEFKKAWQILISGKNWMHKTKNALQISLNKLNMVSEPIALQMINNSIEGNWKGLYAISDKDQQPDKIGRNQRGKIETFIGDG